MGDLERTAEDGPGIVTELRRALGALTVAASNADRSVTVRVDVNGRVAGLTLTAEAVERGHECLAEEIMHVMWAGQWQVIAQVERVVHDALDDDPQLAEAIRRAYPL